MRALFAAALIVIALVLGLSFMVIDGVKDYQARDVANLDLLGAWTLRRTDSLSATTAMPEHVNIGLLAGDDVVYVVVSQNRNTQDVMSCVLQGPLLREVACKVP